MSNDDVWLTADVRRGPSSMQWSQVIRIFIMQHMEYKNLSDAENQRICHKSKKKNLNKILNIFHVIDKIEKISVASYKRFLLQICMRVSNEAIHETQLKVKTKC